MSTMTQQLDADFDMIDWLYGGMESVLCKEYDFGAMTGNESYYCYHFDIWNGMEAEATSSSSTTTTSSSSSSSSTTKTSSTKTSSTSEKKSSTDGSKIKAYADSVKKVAQGLYKNLIDMLKRVREYFFGEGEEAAVEAAKSATEAVEALNELQGAAPIPDDAAARDAGIFAKALQGGEEFQEVLKQYPDLAAAIDRVNKAAQTIGNSDTVAKLRTSYADLVKSANAGIQSVSGALRRCLSEAEKKTNELKNPKVPAEGDTTEVKEGIKQENAQAIEQAKEETKKARIIGGVRNKLVAALNAVSTQSKTVKDKPPQSKFKG